MSTTTSGSRILCGRAFWATTTATLSWGSRRRSISSMAIPRKKVGTHNGSFHCDEALGCYMIRLTQKFAGAEIIRTRDQKILDTMDAVLDVGGIYDPAKDRYDHHQRGFSENFENGFVTKLSSAGLIYKHYGREIVAKDLGLKEDHPDVQRVYLGLYKSFVEAIDGIDNGISQYDVEDPPKYVDNTHLSSRVGRLNPDWTEEQSPEKENAAFHHAMELAGGEFSEALHSLTHSWLPARTIVLDCLAARNEVDPSNEIMVLKTFCPWKLHLFELETEMNMDPCIKYVLYEDERSKQWRIQAVALGPGRFESRRALPLPWRGLRDDELSKETGIDGCVFVHMSGFIGGNKTLEGALAMARKALVI